MSILSIRQHRRTRRNGKPAFTLLELIVVLLVLGILAAIAVPSFQRVKENSVTRSAQTTLEAAARNGQAIATSNVDATDEAIASAVESEFTDQGGLVVSVGSGADADKVTVTLTRGALTATGSVEFVDGVPTITNATTSGGSSTTTSTTAAPALTWSMTAVAWPGWTSGGAYTVSNVVYNSTTKILTFDTNFKCTDTSTFAANSKDLYIRDEVRSTTYSYSAPEGTWSNATGSWVFDPSTGGLEYTRAGGSAVATRSSAGNDPCSFSVDFGAFMTDTGLTPADATDARVQSIYIAMGNGSSTPNGYRLLLS